MYGNGKKLESCRFGIDPELLFIDQHSYVDLIMYYLEHECQLQTSLQPVLPPLLDDRRRRG